MIQVGLFDQLTMTQKPISWFNEILESLDIQAGPTGLMPLVRPYAIILTNRTMYFLKPSACLVAVSILPFRMQGLKFFIQWKLNVLLQKHWRKTLALDNGLNMQRFIERISERLSAFPR